MPGPLTIEEFNEQATKWGKASRDEVRAGLAGIGARRTGALIKEMRVRTGMQFGAINRITFGFLRYLVWIEKGAGRGQGGKKGSRWFTRGELRRTAKESLGKMGGGKRPAHRVFNSIMDKRVPILAGIAATYYANVGAKAILIK